MAQYQGFKGFFRELLPSNSYQVETYLEGHLEREVFRRLDRADATQLEVLFLPENGTYNQIIQLRIKHPKSPALNRLQNAFLVSPIELGTGFFSEEHAFNIAEQLRELLRKGWKETMYCKGKEHLCSIIQWPDGRKWHYNLASQKLEVNRSPMQFFYPYLYRFWGYQPEERMIESAFFSPLSRP